MDEITGLRDALRSAAALLRSTADRADSGQPINPDTLRAAARAADEIAGKADRAD
jgi:hypothetical protein